MSEREGAWRLPWAAAFLVALVATVGSLSFSGIGPTGWRGMGLFPCELCWYQRILMYPLPAIIGVGLWRRSRDLAYFVLPLSLLGMLVAAYHVYIQAFPEGEAGQCFVGVCSAVDWMLLGRLTIPQLSFVAFLFISVFGAVAHWASRAQADA